ncbi:hypothetical protein HUJ05_012539 [Dendroctonus ponderosae]|nr:hypothetical protein HUJ05_012539 [Dendroctonus ponderosae]
MVELDFSSVGTMPEEGVRDMTSLTVLDEAIINKNLKVRYKKDNIYVPVFVYDESQEFIFQITDHESIKPIRSLD